MASSELDANEHRPSAFAQPTMATSTSVPSDAAPIDVASISFVSYTDEDEQLPLVSGIIDRELSEPYSIFTYRYFLNSWPELCFLALDPTGACVGVIVCKLEKHREMMRGYIGMLVVDKRARKLKLGSALVSRALSAMQAAGADECVLEAETTNEGALRLYQSLGFIRDKRLARYYLSGTDAYRLKLLFPIPPESTATGEK